MSHPYNENRKHYKSKLDPLESENGMVTRKHKLHTVYVRNADIRQRIKTVPCNYCGRPLWVGWTCGEVSDPCLPERQAKLKRWEKTGR